MDKVDKRRQHLDRENLKYYTMPEDGFGFLLLFAIIVIAIILSYYLYVQMPYGWVTVSVPRENISAYRLIDSGDIVNKVVRADSVPKNAFNDSTFIYKNYSRTLLVADEIITYDMVAKIPTNFSFNDLVVLGWGCAPETIVGKNLEAGEVVNIELPPIDGNESVRINDVLILDIKNGSYMKSTQPYVLILALRKENVSDLVKNGKSSLLYRNFTS